MAKQFSNDTIVVWKGIIGSYKVLQPLISEDERVRKADMWEYKHWVALNRF